MTEPDTAPATPSPVAAPVPEITAEKPADVATGNTKRAATVNDLLGKPRRVAIIPFGGPDSGLTIKLQALSATAFDALLVEYAPTRAQRDTGATQFNPDTFPQALVAACAVEPTLTLEQVNEIYASGTWSSGELADLFFSAQRVCQAGLDVPFSLRG